VEAYEEARGAAAAMPDVDVSTLAVLHANKETLTRYLNPKP
jgi:hypothetical protein